MPFVNNLVLLEGFVAGEFKRIGENGPAVGQISVSKRVKNRDTKEYETKYDYFDLKGWSQARDVMSSITDGTPVIVSGVLDRESWEDKETKKTLYKTVVLVNTITPRLVASDKGAPSFDGPPAVKSGGGDWDF